MRVFSHALLLTDPAAVDTVYADAFEGNAEPGTLLRSTDGGHEWFVLAPGVKPFDLVIDPRQPTRMYAQTSLQGSFLTSDDGGQAEE